MLPSKRWLRVADSVSVDCGAMRISAPAATVTSPDASTLARPLDCSVNVLARGVPAGANCGVSTAPNAVPLGRPRSCGPVTHDCTRGAMSVAVSTSSPSTPSSVRLSKPPWV